MIDRKWGSLPLAWGSSQSLSVEGFIGDSAGNLIPPLVQLPENLILRVESQSVS